jgi:pimeloyl-ACP methyl ester carboxylesterase
MMGSSRTRESYGTYLGTIYATLFPHRVRAMVLDGRRPAADGSAQALGAAVRHSSTSSPTAPSNVIRAPPRRAARCLYDELRTVRRARASHDAKVVALNDTRFDAAVIEALYSGRRLTSLADALAQADDGDASVFRDGGRFAGRRERVGARRPTPLGHQPSRRPGHSDVDAAARLSRPRPGAAPRLGAFLVNPSLAARSGRCRRVRPCRRRPARRRSS